MGNAFSAFIYAAPSITFFKDIEYIIIIMAYYYYFLLLDIGHTFFFIDSYEKLLLNTELSFKFLNTYNHISPPKVISQLYSGDVFHHQNTNFLCQRTIKNEYVWQTNKSLLISCRRR